MAMFILVLMIAGLIDWAIEKNKKPRNKEAALLGNRIARLEQQEERSKERNEARLLGPAAGLEKLHSIEWDAKTRKVVDIQFEEL
jgi:hypothetical protein